MNPENQATASEILQAQHEHTNRLRDKAAGAELLSRFNSLPAPAIESNADRTQKNELETEINRCQIELDGVLESISNVSERMVLPVTRKYITAMTAHINDLRSRLEPDPPDAESHHPASFEFPEHKFTEEYEDGQKRLAELYQKEREICNEWGGRLAFLECSSRENDTPRRDLRRNLLANTILPSFILDAEQSALETSPQADPVSPYVALHQVEATLNSINSIFPYLFTRPHSGLPVRPNQLTHQLGQDVFHLMLCCNNNAKDQPIHSKDNPNQVLYYTQGYVSTGTGFYKQEALQTSQYPQRDSLDQFFERYPNVARDLALIQAAEEQAGEFPSLFARSLDPHYQISDEDQQQIENLVRWFREMNDQRENIHNIELEKLNTLTRAIAESQQLRSDPNLATKEEALQAILTQLKEAEQKVRDIQQRLDQMKSKMPGIFDFAGRRQIANMALDLQRVETAKDNLQQKASFHESVVTSYRGRLERVEAELRNFGLYHSDPPIEMDRRLNHQKGHVANLRRFLVRGHNVQIS